MPDKMLFVTLAIRLRDFPDTERQALSSDLEVPLAHIRKLEDTPPGDIAGLLPNILKDPNHSDSMFCGGNVYAEIKSVKVVSAAYTK